MSSKLPSNTGWLPATRDGLCKSVIDWARNVAQRSRQVSPSSTNSGPPPLHGVTCDAQGVELDNAASDNDEAIRTSLIWFKHTFPGNLADIDGPEAFRVKVWRIAQEVGTPLTARSQPFQSMPVAPPTPGQR
jgi:hypothetical protein